MVHFDSRQKIPKETAGCKLKFNNISGREINSVLEKDEELTKNGKLIADALNYGISSFTPDLMFEKLVKNFELAKNIYGDSIIRKISGYDEDYLEKNVRIPEFRKVLKKKITENIEKLREGEFIGEDDLVTEKGIELASLVLYTEELDNIMPEGTFGEKLHKKNSVYGSREDVKAFKKSDRYRDIAIKKSVKLAIRRKHCRLKTEDLRVFERQSRGQICLVYGLDASGSMRGGKIEACKKAGIALAYKAIEEKDKVGIIVFGSDIRAEVRPTDNFTELLKEITKITAKKETNIKGIIERAIELFPSGNATKHLILLTDALPTIGKEPEKEAIEAACRARGSGITISLVGISLNEKGKSLAEKITEIGEGKLYLVKDLKEVDKIVLEDYYGVC